MIELAINPELHALVPEPEKEEYDSIKNSIKNEGQHESITVWKDTISEKNFIIDGHTRYKICKELGIDPKIQDKIFESWLHAKKYAADVNLLRRHLSQPKKVEQYFKNPKPEKMITVYGPDTYNEDWFYPKFFKEGERALFYLKKIDDKYIILAHSRAAIEECSPRDMIGLSTLPGEPVGRGGPTLFFDPYQTCNGYLYSVDYLSKTLKPLKQFEAGIKLEDIRCEENLVLVVKIDGSPACVKPASVTKLVAWGWAKI